jgi:hypothetical protein
MRALITPGPPGLSLSNAFMDAPRRFVSLEFQGGGQRLQVREA